MQERIGIFVNKFSRPEAVYQAEHLGELTQSPVVELNGSVPLEEFSMIAVSGGDGSINSVMRQIVKEGRKTPLVVLPGGSHNGLWHSLVDANATVKAVDLLFDPLPEFPLFRPGAVNEALFHHSAGWNPFIVNEGIFNEKLRLTLPRNIRAYGAGAVALLISPVPQKGKESVLHLATTGPLIGSVRVPLWPSLSLHSEHVGLITISASKPTAAKAKAGLLAAYILLGIHVPQRVAEGRVQESFFLENYAQTDRINTDAEVSPLAQSGMIYVRKMRESIPVAALV